MSDCPTGQSLLGGSLESDHEWNESWSFLSDILKVVPVIPALRETLLSDI